MSTMRVAADTVIGSQLLKRGLVTDQQLTVALAAQELRSATRWAR